MKKQYTIIVLLLIWTAVMIAKPIIEALPTPEQKEYDAYMDEIYKVNREIEGQFDRMAAYCKEHEEALMKVSEVFWGQYHEDITPQETAEIAQNNTSPEWTELSKRLTLRYRTDDERGIYYFCNAGGNRILYVIYISEDNEETDRFAIEDCLEYRKERINDNLYVCLFFHQMFGL